MLSNGYSRSSRPNPVPLNKRSYQDVCLPHYFHTCPAHKQRVMFNGKGELQGVCWGCAEDAAEAIRHIEETIA